jgi:hypothetical protein
MTSRPRGRLILFSEPFGSSTMTWRCPNCRRFMSADTIGWVCIGFHLAFLKVGRWFGPHEEAFIRIDAHSPAAVDTTLQVAVLVGLLALIAYPFLARRRVGWRERDPE